MVFIWIFLFVIMFNLIDNTLYIFVAGALFAQFFVSTHPLTCDFAVLLLQEQDIFPAPWLCVWPDDLLWPIDKDRCDSVPVSNLDFKRQYFHTFPVPLPLPWVKPSGSACIPGGGWKTHGVELNHPEEPQPQSADISCESTSPAEISHPAEPSANTQVHKGKWLLLYALGLWVTCYIAFYCQLLTKYSILKRHLVF